MKKMKKFLALMLMGVTLCGNILTAQAACSHIGNPTETWTEIEISYHDHNGIWCQKQRYYEVYDVYCNKCGAYMGRPRTYRYEVHIPQY